MYQTDPVEQVDILQDMLCAGFQEGGKDSCQVRLNQPVVLLRTLTAHILHTHSCMAKITFEVLVSEHFDTSQW